MMDNLKDCEDITVTKYIKTTIAIAGTAEAKDGKKSKANKNKLEVMACDGSDAIVTKIATWLYNKQTQERKAAKKGDQGQGVAVGASPYSRFLPFSSLYLFAPPFF